MPAAGANEPEVSLPNVRQRRRGQEALDPDGGIFRILFCFFSCAA